MKKYWEGGGQIVVFDKVAQTSWDGKEIELDVYTLGGSLSFITIEDKLLAENFLKEFRIWLNDGEEVSTKEEVDFL